VTSFILLRRTNRYYAQKYLRRPLPKVPIALFFTRESSHCFQCVLAITILSVRLPVRLSHGWISQNGAS